MKLEDMILVEEERRAEKTRFLLSFTDYVEMVLHDCGHSAEKMADILEQLNATKEGKGRCFELYQQGELGRHARYCSSEAQLRDFLFGTKKEGLKKSVFDEERCTEECLSVLKAYGISTNGQSLFHALHYEEKDYDFKRGEILHNLNGSDYRVLSVLSEKNLLLMSQFDGQYIVAVGTSMYERYPKEGNKTEDNTIKGVEWGHGIYLGHDLMKIDLDGIMQEYGSQKQISSIGDFRDETRWQFVKLKSLSKNKGFAQVVRWAAEKELLEAFGTTKRDIFEEKLDAGSYDETFYKLEENKKEKLR